VRLTFPDEKTCDSSEGLTWWTMEELGRQIWRKCQWLPGVSWLPGTRCVMSWAVTRCKAVQVFNGGRSMLPMSWIPAPTWPTCQSQKLGTRKSLAQSVRSQCNSCTMHLQWACANSSVTTCGKSPRSWSCLRHPWNIWGSSVRGARNITTSDKDGCLRKGAWCLQCFLSRRLGRMLLECSAPQRSWQFRWQSSSFWWNLSWKSKQW